MDDSDFDEDVVGAIAELEDSFNQTQAQYKISINNDKQKSVIRKDLSANLSVPKTVVQRKFPGPAGLLPERGNLIPENILYEKENDTEDMLLSQNTNLVYEMGPWSALKTDLGVVGQNLLTVINLESVERGFKRTRAGKVPFLSVIVDSVDASLADPLISLKDSTGVMPGVLHRTVWEEWGCDINSGSVIVLRNVGVISSGINSRRLIINITTNNVIAIYSFKLNKSGDIQRRLIRDLPSRPQEISCIIDEWKKCEKTSSFSSPIRARNEVNSPPIKKPRLQETPKIHEGNKQPSNKENVKFQINSSVVDSLLDGIDIDSLFAEF